MGLHPLQALLVAARILQLMQFHFGALRGRQSLFSLAAPLHLYQSRYAQCLAVLVWKTLCVLCSAAHCFLPLYVLPMGARVL